MRVQRGPWLEEAYARRTMGRLLEPSLLARRHYLGSAALVAGIWADARSAHGGGWLRALEEHRRELVAYTTLLTALDAADSVLAAQMAWRRSSVLPVAAAVIFIGSLLLLTVELLGFFMTIDRIPGAMPANNPFRCFALHPYLALNGLTGPATVRTVSGGSTRRAATLGVERLICIWAEDLC